MKIYETKDVKVEVDGIQYIGGCDFNKVDIEDKNITTSDKDGVSKRKDDNSLKE